ncbi:metallo-beta-lactamase [Streptomyces alboflavus]|uniref:Metallo-beta-lactamase n=1 Tax=Streptomyces alboflavus TaxID=67267 RepID=A0A1Z1WN91_9ACTN|nr:metallo-beta-lactamase [Streptomyces alboflavus]
MWIWPDIHMRPEEGVRAHLDLQGGTPHGVLLPIHWGTFNLAPHPWSEPGDGTLAAARAEGTAVALPIPGEPFEPSSDDMPDAPWWRAVARAPQSAAAGAPRACGRKKPATPTAAGPEVAEVG